MMNFIICDDSYGIVDKVSKIITMYMMSTDIEYHTHCFHDYDENFEKIITSDLPFKVYILDIEMPSNSGIVMARKIRSFDNNSIIIFLTGHEELGLTILKEELLILSFINKFDNYEDRVLSCIKKTLSILDQKQVLKIKYNDVIYNISSSDILYITRDSIDRKTIIKTDYEEIKVNKTIIEIIENLDRRFIQTHRSCYVNNDRITKVEKDKIIFDNGETTDLLSAKYKKEIEYI